MSEVVSLAGARDDALERGAAALRDGRLVVVPTDTVYGIAADAFNRGATAAIFRAKGRPRSLPLPVLVANHRQGWALCASVPPAAEELAAAFWPGALTIIVPQAPDLDWDLGDTNGTIALRVPAHDDLLALLTRVGPTAMTSANVSGEPTPPTVEGVRARLGDAVALYVDGGRSVADTGSTIVDLSGARPLVVREGPIAIARVEQVIGSVARA